MTAFDDLDGRLSAWFEAATVPEPEQLLGKVLARTAHTRRVPAWRTPERWNLLTAINARLSPPLGVSWRTAAVSALLLIGLIAGLLLVAGSQHRVPTPFGPAGNGRVAYLSNGQVATSNPDGSDIALVNADARVKGIPTWSRDGTRLGFLSYRDPGSTAVASLIVTDAAGRQPVEVISNVEALQFFSWAPDGKSVAFSYWIEYPGQRDRVFIAPADGRSAPVQVGDPDLSAFNPAFSPDGRRIAFQSDLNGGFGLHVMNVDGTGVRQLMQAPGFIGMGFEGRSWGVEWNPDGYRILFVVNATEGGSATSGLYLVDVDGGGPAARVLDGPENEYAPAWAPDGARVAYLSRDLAGARSVMVSSLDGTGRQQLATGVAGYTPIWSPDGEWVAFVESLGATGATVRVVRLDGSEPPVVIEMPTLTAATHGEPGVDAIGWQRIAP